VRRESRLKLAFVATGAVALWLATFAGAWGSFRFLDRYGTELLGGAPVSLVELLVPRVLALLAVTLQVLLTFSSALLAHTTLYRSREVGWLLTTPTSTRTVFGSRLIEIAFFASWSSAYLGSPVLLAYGMARHASPWLAVAAIAGFLPFVTIPAVLGSGLAMATARLVAALPRRVVILGGTGLGIAAYFVFRLRLAGAALPREVLDVTALLRVSGWAESPWLPSTWFTEGLLAAARGEEGESVFWLLVLLANAMLVGLLLLEAASRWFLGGWQDVAGLGQPTKSRTGKPLLERVLRPLPSVTRALLVKDLRLFRRDPAQWSQVLIFFGVLALYAANLKVPPRGYGADFWQPFITALNTVASLLVLATLTTRFVFPLISLEGRRFWILRLAPLSLAQLMRCKLALAAPATALITGSLAALSGWRLGLPPGPFVFSVAIVLVASLALSALAVGLGALYPDFAAENPSRIVSGLGGTLTFLASMVYVTLIAAAETVVLQWDRIGRHHGGAAAFPMVALLASVAIAALTVLAVWLPMCLGRRHLERYEG
jgi:ABC-2 type transport system permease protein